ncbi:MAG: hypothetical protein AVDCRST_MAG76-1273 [uncultured Acidimicrobiales bacterium]|uniref:Uncharacterized protein n=1 Tax=uncultured Acidimicrobiales bacterium TaxID=310071 RepID=A0A6J4HUE4_9ACTN|nr:MAG: hypothetical protein AVDCRST_MAG76-1273 [uncultured Acidimicrobiales bacterium]
MGCGGTVDAPAGEDVAGDGTRSSFVTANPTASQPKGQPLQLEQRHPNGTVLRVSGIEFGPTSGTVTIEAVNGYTEKVRLNARGIQLVDNTGTRYNLLEPEQNSELEILPGATLRGDLTFLGELDRKASALKLLVNASRSDESIDLAARSDSTSYPKFQFDDIPLPK